MLKSLYFIRHGDYQPKPSKEQPENLRKVDGPLTIMGIEDIVELTNKLKETKKGFGVVYSSPFQRTQETAKLIAKKLHLQVEVLDRLHEDFRDDYSIEHFDEIFKNVNSAALKALNTDVYTNIIVSHQLPISLYISVKSGISYEELLANDSHLSLLKEGEGIHGLFNQGKLIKYDQL